MGFLSDTVKKQHVLKNVVQCHQKQIELYEELYVLMNGNEQMRKLCSEMATMQRAYQKEWISVLKSMQETIDHADTVMVRLGGR